MENIVNILTLINNWIHQSNDVVKLIIIGVCLVIYAKCLYKPLFKLTVWLGKELSATEFIESFFNSKRMVRIFVCAIPLLLLNIILPHLEWTFDSIRYLNTWLNMHNGNQLGAITAENLLNSTQSANVKALINSAPFYNTGKLISNVLYLSNITFFMVWLSALLKHIVQYLEQQERFAKKPLYSFSQIIYLLCLIVMIATVYAHYTDQSPVTLFTTLSVMSVAVFMTLKDIIMGVISTIIIMASDLVKVGDWITISKYNANGYVTKISLTTVEVSNFDKTISNVPTYSLVSEGFQNQREILNSGLNRMKQSFRIETSTIKYLTLEELNQYKEIEILKPYIEKRITEMERQNNNSEINYNNQLNGKHITNLDLFRKYIELYLKQHPMVYAPNSDAKNKLKRSPSSALVDTEPVVHLIEGSKEGVGLEIYCFLKYTDNMSFKNHEAQVTGIMTKTYSSAKHFDLKVNC